eukprot:112270-Pyramimonas_sp.AAC.2
MVCAASSSASTSDRSKSSRAPPCASVSTASTPREGCPGLKSEPDKPANARSEGDPTLRHQGFLQTKLPEDTLCPFATSEVDPSFGTHPSGFGP